MGDNEEDGGVDLVVGLRQDANMQEAAWFRNSLLDGADVLERLFAALPAEVVAAIAKDVGVSRRARAELEDARAEIRRLEIQLLGLPEALRVAREADYRIARLQTYVAGVLSTAASEANVPPVLQSALQDLGVAAEELGRPF